MPDWLTSGFSLVGFAVIVLQQIPGVIWAMRPPKVDPMAQNSGTLLVEILEKTFGIATLLLLVQGNYPALVTSVVFGAVHIGLTYNNFVPGS